jgi:hypothetical protein
MFVALNAQAQLSVTTTAADNIDVTAADVNGSVVVATSTAYNFQYGTSASLAGATTTTPVTITADQPVQERLTGLTAATQYYFRLYAEETATNTNDILHNLKVEEDHILLCGSRASIGFGSSNFLIMKTDHQGAVKFSRAFGSSASDNVLYDALWDNGRIITVGTTSFEGRKTIVLMKLSDEGTLIR